MWIEFQASSGPMLVNTEYIRKIFEDERGTWIIIENGTFRACESYASIVNMLKPLRAKVEQKEVEQIPADTPITDLGLSVRAYNILLAIGCQTLNDILQKLAHYEDVKRIRNLGTSTVLNIVNRVNECGYHFVWE